MLMLGCKGLNFTCTFLLLLDFLNFTPDDQSPYSPYCSLYTSYDTDKESFSNKQDPLKLEIIAYILMTLI